MIDLDKLSEQMDKGDGFLTKLKTLLKKHWGILLIIGLAAGGYYILTDDTPVEDGMDYQDEYYDESAGDEGYQDDDSLYYDEEY